ncbi:MAG: phosphatidylglycerophosphatase A [Bacteroidota bacterium]
MKNNAGSPAVSGPVTRMLLSGFYTGYIPFAPGTFGSLAGLAIYLIPGFEKPYIILPAILLLAIFGYMKAGVFETQYGKKDPSQCTIDEVVGMWISLLFVPKQVLPVLVTFLIWRVCDIIKPFPARSSEKLGGAAGIMTDDIISALYSLLLIHAILFFYF